jgi:copper chaperone
MKMTLSVPGMSCGHCKQSVSDAISELGGVYGVDVDLQTKEVTVHYEEGQVDEAQLRRAIEDAGFEVG